MNHSTNNDQPHALVTGATSQIGKFLLPRLCNAGFNVTAISRSPQITLPEVVWEQSDLTTAPWPLTSQRILFHLAPLPLLVSFLQKLPPLPLGFRIIVFSSTSRFTKEHSPDPKERSMAMQWADAEEKLMNICQRHHLIWTLFRPTLIYGCSLDKNITFITKFIRHFGFFPLLGQGTGLRQPVHADDLAQACLQAYFSPATFNKAYNLSGGQTLTYRDMVIAIFQQLGKPPRFVSIPLPLFKQMTECLKWLPPFAHLSSAMMARMNQNLDFDHSAAYRDFGYQPRRFSDSIISQR